MVHINQVELTHFKSFGGTITIPLEQGFSVVTGPNGSGKSNILDAVLFCLGLASSRGMRAERLPDLINSAMLRAGKGVIINIASVGGVAGARAGAAYDASKHGLIGLTRNIAATYGADGIRCVAIADVQASRRDKAGDDVG